MKKGSYIFGMVFALSFIAQSIVAQEASLSYLTKDKKPIKISLQNFVNESGQNQILAEDFKNSFEKALLKRRSVKFEIANSPKMSDVQISGVIKKYLYSKTDPITTFASPSGLVLDAVTTENYVEMAVEFTVTDTKTGKAVWNGTVSTFIKRMMSPEESIPLIYDKLSRNFLWKSFGKASAFARDAIHSR